MSLQTDIDKSPWSYSEDLVSALRDYKNGKRNSEKKFRKLARRYISDNYCNELIVRHETAHRINKEKRARETSQKRKDMLCRVASFVTVFFSLLCTITYLIENRLGSLAFWYFLLWAWALGYVASSSDKEIARLERENENLKAKLENLQTNPHHH